jgi:biotin carboxyl carrier protein
MGYPPLVTPTSQIVGVQAVQNVLFGRYKMISGQVKDYFYGLYGRPPAPVDPEVQKLALKGYEKGETPITVRAADTLAPEMEKAKEATKGIAKDIGDVLIYAMYPQTGLRFLKWKYGQEPIPDDVKPKTLEQVKKENDLMAKAKAGKLVEKVEKPTPAKSAAARVYNVFVDNEYYQVEVDPQSGARTVSQPTAAAPAPKAAAPAPAAAPIVPQAKAAPAATGDGVLASPMPGTIIKYVVSVGQEVKAGETVLILEAMKMESALPSPIAGKVKELSCKAGDRVTKGAVLAIIEK